MTARLEVLFTPAEFAALKDRDLSRTICVVFDVLRATSSIVTALANGAKAIIPVAEIPEALALRRSRPDILLAGERDGLRIPAALTGGTEFDLGNSPREFTKERVGGRTIALTTTNGTRALRACTGAASVLVGSFLNLRATAEVLQDRRDLDLLLVCSGTFEQAALEDVLAVGALADRLWSRFGGGDIADSALVARQIYRQNQNDLAGAVAGSRNGRRLLSRPELKDDVAWSLRTDEYSLVAKIEGDAVVRVQELPDQPARSSPRR